MNREQIESIRQFCGYETGPDLGQWADISDPEVLGRLCDLALSALQPQGEPVAEALRHAAQVIELYDDATMNADYMLDSTECAGILNALAEYRTRFYAAPADGGHALAHALDLALEYWQHRQQRYKNRSPAWVQAARDALAKWRSRSMVPPADGVVVPRELEGEMLFEMWRAVNGQGKAHHDHESLKYVWRRTLAAAPKGTP